MRELKITNIQGIVFLYPVPVLKDNKYLIRCESIEKANELVASITKKTMAHPDQTSGDYKVIGIHTDQQTKILEKV